MKTKLKLYLKVFKKIKIMHTNSAYIVTKNEIQTYFIKIHMKTINFICICTRGTKIEEFCPLVHMQMEFIVFI